MRRTHRKSAALLIFFPFPPNLFQMFGLSLEHIIILAILLLVFGRKRLPLVGHTIRKTIQNFKEGKDGVEEAEYRTLKKDDEKSS